MIVVDMRTVKNKVTLCESNRNAQLSSDDNYSHKARQEYFSNVSDLIFYHKNRKFANATLRATTQQTVPKDVKKQSRDPTGANSPL